MDWKKLLKERHNTTSKERKILLVLTYSGSLPNISKVVCKYWNILSINIAVKEIFQNEPVSDFRRSQKFEGTDMDVV